MSGCKIADDTLIMIINDATGAYPKSGSFMSRI